MAQRSYTIPMTGVVTIDADTGQVEVEVDLTDLSFDLRYDYDHQYPSTETQRDQSLVTDCLMQSPENFSMKHTMDVSK
jgi:hypothetical protein